MTALFLTKIQNRLKMGFRLIKPLILADTLVRLSLEIFDMSNIFIFVKVI